MAESIIKEKIDDLWGYFQYRLAAECRETISPIHVASMKPDKDNQSNDHTRQEDLPCQIS
ncbi:MAG: hypothetical protein ACE5JC_00755 [Candidatus Zixiibacteriota bacterium]